MAKYRKLGRTAGQRKALLRNQVTALLSNGKIVTTEAKAKEIRKIAEGLIAMAVREKDNYDEVTVTAKVARKDKDGKRVKEVVDGKKVTVYDEVEKKIKKDQPSRLHARREMLKVLYPVKEVPAKGAGKKKNTKSPGRGARVRHRPQRRGENHLPAAGGRGAAGAPGHPGGLHAPGLRRDRGPKPDAGGIFGQKLGEGGAHPGKDLPGQHEVHPRGAGAHHPRALRRAEGQAVLLKDDSGRGQRAGAGRAHPELQPPIRPGDTGHFGGVPRVHPQRQPRPEVYRPGVRYGVSAGAPGPSPRGEPVALKPPFNAKKACGRFDRKPFA